MCHMENIELVGFQFQLLFCYTPFLESFSTDLAFVLSRSIELGPYT